MSFQARGSDWRRTHHRPSLNRYKVKWCKMSNDLKKVRNIVISTYQHLVLALFIIVWHPAASSCCRPSHFIWPQGPRFYPSNEESTSWPKAASIGSETRTRSRSVFQWRPSANRWPTEEPGTQLAAWSHEFWPSKSVSLEMFPQKCGNYYGWIEGNALRKSRELLVPSKSILALN